MRSLIAAALLVALSLAGCGEDSAPKATDEGPDFGDLDLTTDSDKGLIRGVVLDQAVVPVADVKVAILSLGLETTTTETGVFGFADLEPGTYFMEFSKPGWKTTQASEDVVAGVADPEVLKVQMLRAPGTEPFASYLQYSGYIGCAFKAANYVFPNQCEAAGDPDQYDVLDFGTQIVPEVLQSEIVWEFTQEIGSQLGTIQYVEDAEGARQRIGNVWGESPLVCRVTKDSVCSNPDGTGGGGDGLNVTGFPGKFFASVYTACYPQCVIGAVGAGLVLQQEYDLYATAFFNYAPPEDWTLQENGRFDPPA